MAKKLVGFVVFGTVEPVSVADYLLALGKLLSCYSQGTSAALRNLQQDGFPFAITETDAEVARRFYLSDDVVKLRAVAEEWDFAQIAKEVL